MSATDIDPSSDAPVGPRLARLLVNVTSATLVASGLGLAAAAAAGWLGEPGWSLWLTLPAAPALVGLGSIWYLRGREQIRRESAWDIFVERELERESERPAPAIQVGKLVEVRHRPKRRRKTAQRSRA